MEHIRQRLLSGDYPQAYTQQKPSYNSSQQRKYKRMGTTDNHISAVKTSRSHQRRYGLIASVAAVSIVLVISFFVIAQNLMHRPSQTTSPTPALPHTPTRAVNIHMIDSTTGWILCADGSVLRTSDGGLNWSDVTPPALLQLKWHPFEEGSLFSDASTAWIAVERGSSTSLSFHTSDAGQTWQEGTIRTDDASAGAGPRYEITAISPQEAWALDTTDIAASTTGGSLTGVVGLYHTTDGGQTWVRGSKSSDNRTVQRASCYQL